MSGEDHDEDYREKSKVWFIDQCNEIDGLMDCLSAVIRDREILKRSTCPQDYLIFHIQEKIKEIKENI